MNRNGITIFDRNLRRGHSFGEAVEPPQTVYVQESNPLSTHYQIPTDLEELTPYKLSAWLVELHERQGMKSFLSLKCNLKMASNLMRKYDHELLIRATHQASLVSQYPFTFRFVERFIEELDAPSKIA